MKDSPALRFIDKYVGTLICAAFSLLPGLRRRNQGPISKVLFVEFFEMGVAVAAYSAVKYMKARTPSPEIFCLCASNSRACWELLGEIPPENIYTVEGGNPAAFVWSLLKRVRELRKVNLDLVIDLELFMRVSSIAAFLIKSRSRAGFYGYDLEGLYRGSYYDVRCGYNQNMHISKNFLALAKAATERQQDQPAYKNQISTDDVFVPAYRGTPDLSEKMRRKIREVYPLFSDQQVIAVCPDVGKVLAVRNYPMDQYVKVIAKLLERYPDAIAVLIGVRENEPTCSYIQARVGSPRCVSFCGRTASIQELMEVLSLSALLIGNDNGPAHFAAMTGTPALALFSTDSPFVWGPLGKCVVLYRHYHCSPCIMAFNHKKSRCRNNLCLQTLTADTVIDHAVRILEGEARYRTINGEIPYM